MTSPRLTRCPKCNTSFRVTQMQLRAANGSVRCGSCLDVFDARKHMINNDHPPAPEIKKQPAPTERQPKATVSKQRSIKDIEPTKEPQKTVKISAVEKQAEPEQESDNLHKLFHQLDKEHLDVEEHREKRKLKTVGWLAAISVTVISLGLQYLWFNKNTLSTNERLRPTYLWVCDTLGCELPDLINIAAVKSVQLLIRTHPSREDGLIIDSVIINEAGFAQPWPKIELIFTDINGKPVASRVFRPNEYLGGALAGSRNIPSNQPVRLSIEIVDPGQGAVNYQLKFHPA